MALAQHAYGTAIVLVTVNPARAAQFNAGFYDLGEGSGSVVVTVTRSGDVSGVASVDYQTSDGTASSRTDYTTALGTLRFAPGEATKTFTVFITDDGYVEGPETVGVTLTNPSGVGLGFPSSTLITVSDNDLAAPTQNPIEASQYFVRQHYRDFLSRDPDADGLQFWTREIEQCGSDAQCREVKRVNVSAAFFLSIEFQETGYLVYRMYKAAFGDQSGKPSPMQLREFLADTQAIGQGVQVNVGNWQQQLESNKNAFASGFAARARFTSLYQQEMTPAQFVDALNVNTGGSLSQSERDSLAGALSSGTKTRAEVLRAVAEDADFARAESNNAFVLMQYFGYLRRNPNDLPDSDFSGYQFWLGKLNQFNGNFIQAEMVKAFLSSIEYRQRFSQ